MLISISGINDAGGLTAQEVTLANADIAPTTNHVGYTYRTPEDEAVGIEVTVYRSQLGIAPELIHYEVTDWWGFDTQGPSTGTVDRRQHDLAYMWDMGLPGQKYDTARNILPIWQEANNPIGHRAVALRAEGSAEWSVTVLEKHSNKSVLITGTDLVGGETDMYSQDRILIVDDTGAGDFTTFDAAIAATYKTNVPHLIILEDGQSHTLAETTLNRDFPSLRIRSRNPGGQAKLIQASDNSAVGFLFTDYDQQKLKQFELIDLELTGHWDSTTETMQNGALQPADLIKCAGSAPACQTILNCNASGWKTATRVASNDGTLFGVYGTKVTNWQDYGIYDSHTSNVSWSRTAIVNSEIAQHPDALCGGPKSSQPWHNTHGPYRTPNGSVMFYASYLFARNGWSAKDIDGDADDSLMWDPNPCIRLAQNGARGATAMLRCCTLEGGGSIFAIKGANGTRADRPVNIVLGQFLAVMGPRTRNLLSLGYSGVTIEAFQAIRTGGSVITEHFDYRSMLFHLNTDTDNSTVDPDALSERVRMRNWTYLNQRSDAEASGGTSNTGTGLSALDSADFTDLKATNYVLHSTNAVKAPAVDFAPVNLEPLTSFETSERGYRDDAGDPQPSVLWIGDEAQFVANSGSPKGSIVLAVPQYPSIAIGGANAQASDETAVYDLFKGLIDPNEPGDSGSMVLTP
ncbi:hypothetical protein L0666_16895 [Octadecabacter sp. CECT 8868]|uniref:hypothetical protein n=1 Tax=Octadecabacter algicola TaxID=2909342 RepID=UPI001F3AADDA|nr:hypothetical protein [Octadecabacter algicola]MCF2906674.1 hypothetical protein [Octadecabacter algicola]